jgi:hypothetical protein
MGNGRTEDQTLFEELAVLTSKSWFMVSADDGFQ